MQYNITPQQQRTELSVVFRPIPLDITSLCPRMSSKAIIVEKDEE